ncbi:MAG: hypothetical protein Q9160_008908 [Pyrenula sp. 1 TL-2023]
MLRKEPSTPGQSTFIPLPNERLLRTTPSRIALSITTPKAYPGNSSVSISSASGIVYLTNQRIVYLPTNPSPNLESFSCPLLNLHDTHITAPFFGPNAWTALLQPVPNGGIPSTPSAIELKLTFKEGGAYDFHSDFEAMKERLQQAVENARDSGTAEPGRMPGIGLQGVDLEPLPAYEATASPPSLNTEILATSHHSPHPLSPRVEAMPDPPSLETPEAATTETFAPPVDPPPGYEEVQQQSVVAELERRLSGHTVNENERSLI